MWHDRAVDARAWVHEAEIELKPDVDPRAVGGAVTVALCGHWDHEGPCRWPHNNDFNGRRFRTLFVAAHADEPDVRRRIRAALHGATQWSVISDGDRPVASDEQELADHLLRLPRRSQPMA